jgi:threonine efflux protein
VRLWKSGVNVADAAGIRMSPAAAFRLGFLTNIMNPKSALFFGSVFATALPLQPSSELLAAAVAVVVVNALFWHMLLAIAFSHRLVQAMYARQRLIISRIAGALVGVFGLRLLFAVASEARSR